MHVPHMNSSIPFSPLWSGITDSSLRPTLMCVVDGSGYRPATASELTRATVSGDIQITGVVTVNSVGITGRNGNILDVFTSNGVGNLPTVTTQSGFWRVGITGAGGLGADVVSISGRNAIAVFLQSGSTGGGSSIAPKPTTQGVYAIDITGTNFDNYASVSTLGSGASVTMMSVEPDSRNTFPVYYSFSGTATTGQAWELRGERTIEVNSTRDIFWSSASGTQRVMIHFQNF